MFDILNFLSGIKSLHPKKKTRNINNKMFSYNADITVIHNEDNGIEHLFNSFDVMVKGTDKVYNLNYDINKSVTKYAIHPGGADYNTTRLLLRNVKVIREGEMNTSKNIRKHIEELCPIMCDEDNDVIEAFPNIFIIKVKITRVLPFGLKSEVVHDFDCGYAAFSKGFNWLYLTHIRRKNND